MKVKILKEVTSEPQRKYMCAMKDAGASERPDGLSQAEAEEMCKSEVHECGSPMKPVKVNIVKSGNDLAVDEAYMGKPGAGANPPGWGPSKQERRKKAVQDLGFLNVKQIGEGAFGTVFRATEGEGEFREAAVKVLDNRGGHAKKEVRNYVKIDQARTQNKFIARHFPKVYSIIKTDKHTLIAMELLDPTSAGMSVIGDFLQGPEGAPHVGRPSRTMKDIDAMYKQKYGKGAGLMKTDMTGRVKNMLLNPKILDEIVYQFITEFPTSPDDVKEIEKNIYSSSLGVLNAKPEVAQKNAYELEDTLLQLGAIEPNTLEVIIKDLENDMTLVWLIMIMIKEVYTNIEDKEYFSERVGFGIRNLILKIRSSSPINVTYDPDSPKPGHSEEEIANADPGAKSIMLAINALMEDFGIVPYDVHDKNALIRPGTDDIVIVDLGNFKEKTPRGMRRVDSDDPHYSPYGMNESKRRIKVFIDRR